MLLKKRTGTDEAFLSKLESVLSECNCADFLSRIQEYKVQNPDLFQEPPSQLNLPDGTRTGFKPKPGQSEKFRSSLLHISRTIGKKQLEIMVGLSPTPEAAKQNISEGHELFEQMERHGCISENDTEMLQEMLELLRLQDALKFLYEYHRAFPPIIHDPPPPSAPQYASLLSSSLQAQHGSLPEYGNQYPSRQPQSFHVSQPQSLPLRSPSSSMGRGGQTGRPASYSSSSQQPSFSSSQPTLSSNAQASLGQDQHSLSSTLGGGSGSFAPLSHSSSSLSASHPAPAPLGGEGRGGGPSLPYEESGEQNSNLARERQFVPSVSPSLQHQSLAVAMKSFPQQGGRGGSTASSPPQSHTPSLAGSSNDTYPRPLARKRPHQGGATPNGSLHYEESHSDPTSALSSGTYPRPLQEMGKSYRFPTSEVLNSRQRIPVRGPKENNDDTTALSPPSAKIRRSSPDQHIGDGGCLSIQRPRTQESSNQGRQGQPPTSSSSSQAPDTNSLSTLSSYTGSSERFDPAVTQGHIPNPGGGAAAAMSLGSLESYSANFSFPTGGDRPPSMNASVPQQPIHDVTAAAAQRPPPFNPHYPPTLSAASSGSTPYSSSINILEGEQPSSVNFQPRLECASGGLVSHASSLSSYSGGSLSLPAPIEAHSQSESSSSGLGGDSRTNSLGGVDQFRNAQPGSFVQCARHHDNLVHVGIQQPFHHQYASHSASVAGSLMPSLSSYRGHPSGNFAHAIQEQGGGNIVPPVSEYKSTQYCEDENLANNLSTLSGEDIQCSNASETKPSKEYQETVEENNAECESQPPGNGHDKQQHHQQQQQQQQSLSFQAYNSPPAPVDKRKSILSKSEARSAQGAAATQFESLSEAVGGPSKLSRYQQQLLEYQKRHPIPYSHITEHGRNIAQASSENNVELRRTGNMQSALATAKEGEQALQQPASAAENLLYQTAESNQLYPRLPLTAFETASSSSGAALAGTKRTRSQSQKLENSEEGKQGEEQGAVAKRQKTNKKSSTAKKQGIVSRVVGYFFRSSASNDDDQSQEEGCENAESESEYHSAKED